MRVTAITSCYIGPEISPEQFVAEHFFLYLGKGTITGYDGHKKYTLKPGEACMVRKNHLAKYSKQKDEGVFEKVVIIFDEPFLKKFDAKHRLQTPVSNSQNAFVLLKDDALIHHFVQSLMPYYSGTGKIDQTFADLKREELLLILLRTDPELAGMLFDFGMPEKIDLEAFMNRNYTFNVSIERFAYLTGRSLSAFKRDFKKVFNDTPNHWLVQKRLEEAYFRIDKKGKRSSDIYLDLGFEDLSHFSYAFKKLFGHSPTDLSNKKKPVTKHST